MLLSEGGDKELCSTFFPKVLVKGYFPSVELGTFRAVGFYMYKTFCIARVVMMVGGVEHTMTEMFSEVELHVSGVFQPSPYTLSHCWLVSCLLLPPYCCQAETSCSCLIHGSVCGVGFQHKAICDRLYSVISAGSLTSH